MFKNDALKENRMKLQASNVGSYKKKDGKVKSYKKIYAIIASEHLKTLKWKAGDEVEQEVRGNELILRKQDKKKLN